MTTFLGIDKKAPCLDGKRGVLLLQLHGVNRELHQHSHYDSPLGKKEYLTDTILKESEIFGFKEEAANEERPLRMVRWKF